MDSDYRQEKFIRMTTAPVEGLVFTMAVPAIVSMLISALYNMADTFFVAKISTEATGAIGIVFSYMALIQAVSFFFGHGSGNYVSRALGMQDRENAQKMASTAFFLTIACGIGFIFLGYIFMDPFLRLLGSTKTILMEARNYFRLILLASPCIMGSFVLNNQMRYQGNAKLGMIGILVGAVLNVVLDPVMIFGLKFGIRGAALATALSQTISFFLLIYLSSKKDGLPVRISKVHITKNRLKEIVAGGLPSLGRQGLASIAGICLNNVAGMAAGAQGDSAIAAFSVVNRIVFIAFSIMLGFGQGFQPVCGFNYGARRFNRVRKAFWFCVKISSFVLLVIASFLFVFATPVVELFRKDDAVLTAIATRVLRYSCISLPFLGWYTMTTMFLQNIRKTVSATLVATARQGILFLPLLYILQALLGLDGVELAQPMADILSFAIAVPFSIWALKGMPREASIADEAQDEKLCKP